MDIYVRACRKDEFRRFLQTCEAAFGYDLRDDDVERFGRIISAERTFAAFEGESMVGTTGSFEFSLTIPGGELPTGGVTMVGVPVRVIPIKAILIPAISRTAYAGNRVAALSWRTTLAARNWNVAPANPSPSRQPSTV
jgi:hypothetical protein